MFPRQYLINYIYLLSPMRVREPLLLLQTVNINPKDVFHFHSQIQFLLI